MAHGYLKGVAWGSVVSVAALAGLSVFSEAPRTPAVTAEAPRSVTKPGVVLEPTHRSLGDRAPMIGRAVPRTPEPGADSLSAVPESARLSAAQPDVGVVSDPPPAAAPESSAGNGGVRPADAAQGSADAASRVLGASRASLDGRAPRIPPAPGGLIAVQPPDAAPASRMVRAPAPPALRLAEPPHLDIAEPAAPARTADASESAPFAEISRGDRPGIESLSAPGRAARPPEPDAGSSGDRPASAPRVGVGGAPVAAGSDVATDRTLERASKGDAPVAVGEGPVRIATELARDEGLVPSAPADRPALPRNDRVAEVRINRLPTLGDRDEPDLDPEARKLGEVAPTAAETGARPVQDPPFSRFAVPLQAASDKPPVAVVLMDDGADLSSDATGIAALRALPYPVSVAVDALLPDAARRMRVMRDAGFEVLATVDLPEGAKAQDAEVSLAAAIEAVPEALAVLEGARTGVQTSIDAASHAAAFLAASGHGLVAQNRGLNTVQMLATRAGVPAGVVFRDLDGEEQDPNAILRTLDQAAFRAGQEGGVILLGRLRPETIAALRLWSLEGRADRVSIVPVSTVLKADD